MRERSKRAVLKTAVPERVPGVRIPLPPPCSLGCRETRLHSSENRRKSAQFCDPLPKTGQEKVSPCAPQAGEGAIFSGGPMSSPVSTTLSGESNAITNRRFGESDSTLLSGLTADHPCKSTVKEKTALRARSRVRALQRFKVRPAAMPLGDGSCCRRTNHPLVASGSDEPSHKIELVFSASLETVVGASGVRTPSLNRPSAGPGSLHAV